VFSAIKKSWDNVGVRVAPTKEQLIALNSDKKEIINPSKRDLKYFNYDKALFEQEQKEFRDEDFASKEGKFKDVAIREKYFKDSPVTDSVTILTKISTSTHPLAPLAKQLLKYAKLNNSTIILDAADYIIVNGIQAAGVYKTKTGDIQIAEFANFRGKGSEATLIHEILHSLTYSALRDNSQVKQDLEKLFNSAKKELGSEYALTNLDEFVVALFSDAKFIQKLTEIKATDGINEIKVNEPQRYKEQDYLYLISAIYEDLEDTPYNILEKYVNVNGVRNQMLSNKTVLIMLSFMLLITPYALGDAVVVQDDEYDVLDTPSVRLPPRALIFDDVELRSGVARLIARYGVTPDQPQVLDNRRGVLMLDVGGDERDVDFLNTCMRTVGLPNDFDGRVDRFNDVPVSLPVFTLLLEYNVSLYDCRDARELAFLQQRSEHAVRNNGYAKAARDKYITNLQDIKIRWLDNKGKSSKLGQSLWDEFAKNPTLDGYGNFSTFFIFITCTFKSLLMYITVMVNYIF